MSAAAAATVAPAAAPARPYTARLLDVLRGFATDDPGSVLALDVWSLHGVGRDRLVVQGPVEVLPRAILDALLADRALRIAPVTRGLGGQLRGLAAPFAYWRLPDVFTAETGWRYAVPPEDQARVAAALGGFPLAPAFLLDAGPEVIALWRLAAPLAVDGDPGRAVALLTRLAARLGSDVEAARDLSGMLPLAGVVRNWNGGDLPDHVELLDVEPGRTYTVEQLEAACASEGAAPKKGRPS